MSANNPQLPGAGVTVRIVRDDGSTYAGVTLPGESYTPARAITTMTAVSGLTASEQARALLIAPVMHRSPREPYKQGNGWGAFIYPDQIIAFLQRDNGSHLSWGANPSLFSLPAAAAAIGNSATLSASELVRLNDMGGTPTPTPTPTLGVAASRMLSPPRQKDASKTFLCAETWHLLYDDITGTIEVWWPNFYTGPAGAGNGNGAADIAPGAAATATAQITYTDKTSSLPVTVNFIDKTGGTTALSATDGGWFKATATINAAAGSVIYPRLSGSFSAGIFYSLGHQDIGAYNATHRDRLVFGTSAIPLANPITDTFPSYRTWYGPCFIGTNNGASAIGIVGDSIEDGIDDMVSDTSGRVGFFQRLFAAKRTINLCATGDTADTFNRQTISPRRWELAQFCDRFANGLGINDFLNNSISAAALETLNTSIETKLGKPTIRRTLTPFQGFDPSQRAAYNTGVRAKGLHFDPAIVLEGAAGTWSNEDAVAFDRLHPTAVGGAYGAANGTVVGTTDPAWGVTPRAAGAVFPAIVNLAASPRDFSTGTWTKSSATVVTTQLDAEAQSSAQAIKEVAATSGHGPAQGPITVAPASAETYEVWFDAAGGLGRDWLCLGLFDQTFGSQGNAWFNVTTGATGSNFFSGTGMAFLSLSITPIIGTGGYYRCKLTFTKTAAVTGIYIQIQTALANSGGPGSVPGDINKGFYLRPGASSAVLRKIA